MTAQLFVLWLPPLETVSVLLLLVWDVDQDLQFAPQSSR